MKSMLNKSTAWYYWSVTSAAKVFIPI